jgi:polyhydroxyalkanoate synthesis regulator phasin
MDEQTGVKRVFGEAVTAVNQTIRTFNEQARQLTRKVMESGRLSRAEARELVSEIRRHVKANRLMLENTLSTHLSRVSTKIGAPAAAPLDDLKRKVAKLGAEVEKVTGRKRAKRKARARTQ